MRNKKDNWVEIGSGVCLAQPSNGRVLLVSFSINLLASSFSQLSTIKRPLVWFRRISPSLELPFIAWQNLPRVYMRLARFSLIHNIHRNLFASIVIVWLAHWPALFLNMGAQAGPAWKREIVPDHKVSRISICFAPTISPAILVWFHRHPWVYRQWLPHAPQVSNSYEPWETTTWSSSCCSSFLVPIVGSKGQC